MGKEREVVSVTVGSRVGEDNVCNCMYAYADVYVYL